jgi:hypothetical protein
LEICDDGTLAVRGPIEQPPMPRRPTATSATVVAIAIPAAVRAPAGSGHWCPAGRIAVEHPGVVEIPGGRTSPRTLAEMLGEEQNRKEEEEHGPDHWSKLRHAVISCGNNAKARSVPPASPTPAPGVVTILYTPPPSRHVAATLR